MAIKTRRKKLPSSRWSAIKKKFGLTEEQWWKIYNDQKGLCFICERKLKIGGKQTRSSVHTDHCHETGKIRGLLCRRCNMDVVPYFEKNISAANKLYLYLTRKKHYGFIPD